MGLLPDREVMREDNHLAWGDENVVSEEQGGAGEQWQDTDDWHLNAILPHAQAASSEMGYIWGYEQAVGSLTTVAEHVVAEGGYIRPGTYVMMDTIIFPLLFSARHFLELSLKRVIRRARIIGEAKQTTPPAYHDLRQLYEKAVKEVQTHVPRSLSFVEKLEGPVDEFHALDPEGDAMRYAGSKSDVLHLAGVRQMNIGRFQAWFDHLRHLVSDAFLALDYDENELESGTATKDYDRAELFALARRLPPRDTWTNETLPPFFEEEKAKKPTLSRKRFDVAIDRILTRPWLSILVGVELQLAELSEDLFHRLVMAKASDTITEEEWGALYCLQKVGAGYPLESYSAQLKRAKEGKKAVEALETEQAKEREQAGSKKVTAKQRKAWREPRMAFYQDSMSIYYCEGSIRSVLSSHTFTFCRGLELLGQPALLQAFRSACEEVGLHWAPPSPDRTPKNWPRLPIVPFNDDDAQLNGGWNDDE